MRFLSIILFVFAVANVFAEEDKDTFVKKGDIIENMSYIDTEGQSVPLIEEGKHTLVFFFATWCGPCRKELAYVEKHLYEDWSSYKNLKLVVFGREHSQEEVDKFVKTNNYKMTYLADPKRELYSKFAKAYIPRCYFVSEDKKVLFNSVGFEESKIKELEKLIVKYCK